MKLKEIIEKSKKNSDENDSGSSNIIGYYIWRNIAFLFIKFLININITPNQITFLSLLSSIFGFALMILADSTVTKLISVLFFCLWAILDNVDGGIARIKKQFSNNGDLWDAAAGYAAMSLIFISMGMTAYNPAIEASVYLVLIGGLTGIASLYPRLLMHFKYHGKVNKINDKNGYGRFQLVVFNIVTPDGFVIPLMIIAVIFHIEWFFTLGYGLLYLTMCVYYSCKILGE